MDLDKTIKELSQNEKKVLLTLKKLNGKASPENILKNGNFSQEVEVMNASSWLQSKKLVKIEDHIHTVYSLGKEGKQFVNKQLPEKRVSLKLISEFLIFVIIAVAITRQILLVDQHADLLI